MLSEKLNKLRMMLVDAKLAGSKGGREGNSHTYLFRSNEQAADVATEVVDKWLSELTIRKPNLDSDDLALVELVSKTLWDAETEWRNHGVDNREDYANKFYYQAEAVIEALSAP